MPSPTPSAANVTLAETVPTTVGGSERTMSAGSSSAGASRTEDLELRSLRFNWQLKALVPVVFVLLAGLLLLLVATVSLRDLVRHAELIGAGAFAVAICAVLIVVLAYVIQRHRVELR